MSRSLVASDNFNRADAGLGGGDGWTQINTYWGSIAIVSNALADTGEGNNPAVMWSGAGTWTADQYAKMVVSALGSYDLKKHGAVILRASNDNPGAPAHLTYYDAYVFGNSSVRSKIGKRVNNVPTNLSSVVGDGWVDGDTCEIEAEGTTIRILKNGVVLRSVTDSDIAGSSSTPAGTCGGGDNWEGGNLVAGTTGDGLDDRFVGHRVHPGTGPFAKAWRARNKFPAHTDRPDIGVMPEAHTAPLEWRRIRPGKGPFLKAWLQSRTTRGDTDAAKDPNIVAVGQVTHSYTARAPQVQARVQPAQAAQTYTAQAPKFVGAMKPPQATHSYTAQTPQVRARVQPGAASHAYTARAPQVQARVAPSQATHSYAAQVPSVAVGALSAPAATHTYTARAPQAQARVAPGAATHTYTARLPKFVGTIKPAQATHAYTARAPQVQARVQPAQATHTYSAKVPQVRARVQPAQATHTYTARAPGVSVGAAVAPPAASQTYTARAPQARARVQPAQASHSYAAQAPQARATLRPAQATHAYTARAPQARASVLPAPASHTYTARAPQARARVAPPAASHAYTAQAPTVFIHSPYQPEYQSLLVLGQRSRLLALGTLNRLYELERRNRTLKGD